jgi:hypothetical protein
MPLNISDLRRRRAIEEFYWQRAPGMEIDDIPVIDIEGIELYRSDA